MIRFILVQVCEIRNTLSCVTHLRLRLAKEPSRQDTAVQMVRPV